MRYSIITPSLARPSLVKLCVSLDNQTNKDWEHIVSLDYEPSTLGPVRQATIAAITHPQRRVLVLPGYSGHGGNHHRHALHTEAQGDYIMYWDDDNYVIDDWVLDELKVVTKPWAIYPLLFQSKDYYMQFPLRVGGCDGNQIMVSRKLLPPYLNLPGYDTDGVYIKQLEALCPDFDIVRERPLIVYPRASCGAA